MTISRMLRSRRFVLLFLAMLSASATLLILASVLIHNSGAEYRILMAQEDEIHATGMRRDAIAAVLQSAVSDLLFLQELNEVEAFMASSSRADALALAHELEAFSRTRAIYDQIRVLSSDGMELMGIDRESNSSYVVPPEDLQYKGDRYYFQEMLGCAADTVYVSQLDLNVENGELEWPIKPILRFGIRRGRAQSVQGYLLLNLMGSVVLDAFDSSHPEPGSEAFLLSPEGYWFQGPSSEVEWGFEILERNRNGFQFDFPEEWLRIVSSLDGQFETENGLFTFDTIVPYSAAELARCELEGLTAADAIPPTSAPYHWKNVAWLPPSALRSIRHSGALTLAGWNVVGILVLGMLAWLLSRWVVIRHETHEQTLNENTLLESTLQKYIPGVICERLLGNPNQHGRLGGESQDLAVLFVDIRGFTGFAETHDPQYVVSVLNRTLTELTTPLRVMEGILDKYTGDGFLAFFEPKQSLADANQRAVTAACLMQKAFRNLWGDAESAELRELGLGIGISTGRVVIGNVGSEDSMDYTVVGDAVNVAARLQGLANPGEILISVATHSHLLDDRGAEIMRAIKLRGRDQALDIYRIAADC